MSQVLRRKYRSSLLPSCYLYIYIHTRTHKRETKEKSMNLCRPRFIFCVSLSVQYTRTFIVTSELHRLRLRRFFPTMQIKIRTKKNNQPI